MTGGKRLPRWRAGGLVTFVGAALLIAGCGSSSSSSKAPAAANPSPSGSGTAAAVKISTAKGSSGTYLVGPNGRALYLWAADTGAKSSCSGACAGTWPPLTTTGTPGAASGVNAALLGTVTRSDGTKQVTYMGHPLYYYAPDTGAGMTTGQGTNSFGAKWWLVAPSGASITKVSASSSSGGGGSSSGGGGGSSSGGGGGSSSGGGGGSSSGGGGWG